MGKPPEQEPSNIREFRPRIGETPSRRSKSSPDAGGEFFKRVKENLGLEPHALAELLDTLPEKDGEPVSLSHRRVLKKYGLKEWTRIDP